jgi:ABC-type glutathione transport system ATPase component
MRLAREMNERVARALAPARRGAGRNRAQEEGARRVDNAVMARPAAGGSAEGTMVLAVGLQKRYPVKKREDFVAVAGVDFALHRGECFGFLGPNGAGKPAIA